MRHYAYRLLNVFAESTFGGNPLCVFDNGEGLSSDEMQALALQFNLSETTFILPSTVATARVRIFTPDFEMPFAGHPTLGSAHAVRGLRQTDDELTLEMQAGIIPVSAQGDRWKLAARPANAANRRPANADFTQIAAALGLDATDIAGPPMWIDTGSEQLVIPIASPEAVRRAQPDAKLIEQHCHNGTRSMTYLWARTSENTADVRFFFPKGGAIIEDPGTGSACANLGGYLLAQNEPLPVSWTLSQGEQTGRPCTLTLEVDAQGNIFVGGQVIELGRGIISLP
jgi:trans-2,3-dihydro-3-hydroxyanthranilate isomerase